MYFSCNAGQYASEEDSHHETHTYVAEEMFSDEDPAHSDEETPAEYADAVDVVIAGPVTPESQI